MKNLIIVLLFASFCIQSSFGQEVNTKNWTLIHERTASWCPFCGSWGWSMKEQTINKFANDNVIFMAVHYSGDLMNPTSVEFGENFGGVGQPIFFVDGVNINVTESRIPTKLEETQLEVDFKKDLTTIAGVGITAKLDEVEKSISVDAKVEFLTDVEGGDYYFGLYLLEDVLNIQSGRTGVQLHKNVLRNSFLDNVFNNPLQTGAITQGTTFNISGKLDGLIAAKENYKVVGIIWTKVGNKYIFFNANIVPVSLTSSSKDDLTTNNEFEVFQSESGNVVVKLTEEIKKMYHRVLVTDISGKTITSTDILNQNDNLINISGQFNRGIHIVTLINDKDKVSKKIVLE